jgi:RNA polymerase sigma-70 factor (ECF subfamily)
VNLPATSRVARAASDAQLWLDPLRARDDEAVARLHTLLVHAARFEVARRRPSLPHLRGEELDALALEAAGDAAVSILGKLDDYRGESRFTTWAYKFALYEAAVKLRARDWQRRELPLDPESWTLVPSGSPAPAEQAEKAALLAAISRGIESALTPHQRRVLVALALDGVPIDVLAERLGSTRGALYKTLHDARAKLRAHLSEEGLEP